MKDHVFLFTGRERRGMTSEVLTQFMKDLTKAPVVSTHKELIEAVEKAGPRETIFFIEQNLKSK